MRYRSKVVEIDAWQWDGLEIPVWRMEQDALPEWLHTAMVKGEVSYDRRGPCLWVKTLEGTMCAHAQSWIVQGTEGELYPVKPSVFERKYENADLKPERWTHAEYEEFAGVIIGAKYVWRGQRQPTAEPGCLPGTDEDWIGFERLGSQYEQRMSRASSPDDVIHHQYRKRGDKDWLDGRPPD